MVFFVPPDDSIRLDYRASGVAALPGPAVSIQVELVAPPGSRFYDGRFTALGKSFAVRSEDADGKPVRCEIDGSNCDWKAQTKLGWTRYVAEANLRAGSRTGHVTLVRIASPTQITVLPDYGYVGKARIDGRDFAAVAAGDLSPSSKVWIDRNGDGRRQSQSEVLTIGVPFNFSGITHELRLGSDGLSVVRSPRSVERMPDAPDLRTGHRLPALSLGTRSGNVLRIPGPSSSGKLVLLDFWASWCPPCIEALPSLAKAYARFRASGLEIVGVCADDEASVERADDLARSRGAVWTEIADGKGMASPTIGGLGIEEIPKLLLVDGDTGRIVATEVEVDRSGLEAIIDSALRAKAAPPRR